MSFLYELHCHTKGVSICGQCTPEEAAELYLQAGYSGVVVTDHMNHLTFRGFPAEAPWREKVAYFLRGWERFRDAAAGRMDVLLGMELRFDENDNDYLVYGVGEEFLLAHPEMMAMTPASFAQLAHENGLLIYQAHPFRDKMTVLDPSCLDGIEVWNGHPGHDSRNAIAEAWAENFGRKKIGGSDFHFAAACGKGGICTEAPLPDNTALLEALRQERYQIYRG